MSAAASKAVVEAAASDEMVTGAPLVESANDSHETLMTYDSASRVPWWVVAVWISCMAGLVAYMVFYLFPDLAKWGAP